MRIISLISAGTEMLFALGLGEQVVAVSHECDWPAECKTLPRVTQSNVDSAAESGAIDRQVHDLLTAGKPLYEIDVRQLCTLRPNFIVTQAQCDVCAVRYADVLSAVQTQAELQETQVLALNPQLLGDVFADLLRIGVIAGAPEPAKKFVEELQHRINRLRERAADIPMADRPRVALIEWTKPLMLSGNWAPELIEIAGGRCELTPYGQHSRCFEWDELLAFDPEVIVVCPCGFDLSRAEVEIQGLSKRCGWQNLAAVKTNRVFPLDGNAYFNRPGPRLVDSVERLSQFIQASVCP